MKNKIALLFLPFFATSLTGCNFSHVEEPEVVIEKNEILVLSDEIEKNTNDDMTKAKNDAANNGELFYVTEYRLDNERKYTGYVDSSYCPQSFGTLCEP